MADAVRNVILRVRMELDGVSQAAIQKIVNSRNDMERSITQTRVKETRARLGIESEAEREMARLQRGREQALSRYHAQYSIHNREVVSGFGKAAEASARLTRGIMLLAVSSEKDLRKVAESLLKIQADRKSVV